MKEVNFVPIIVAIAPINEDWDMIVIKVFLLDNSGMLRNTNTHTHKVQSVLCLLCHNTPTNRARGCPDDTPRVTPSPYEPNHPTNLRR